jgi:hypothetical protein
VLDLRGVLAVRECPFVSGFCETGVGFGLEDGADDKIRTPGRGVEATVTSLVLIFRGAFFAFMAENDKGRPSVGKEDIVGNKQPAGRDRCNMYIQKRMNYRL